MRTLESRPELIHSASISHPSTFAAAWPSLVEDMTLECWRRIFTFLKSPCHIHWWEEKEEAHVAENSSWITANPFGSSCAGSQKTAAHASNSLVKATPWLLWGTAILDRKISWSGWCALWLRLGLFPRKPNNFTCSHEAGNLWLSCGRRSVKWSASIARINRRCGGSMLKSAVRRHGFEKISWGWN